MLAFNLRFHGYGSLRYVYKNGKTLRSRLLTVKYTTNPRRRRPRFSVVVSKKVLKSAVGRNRIRRRIYETIRRNITDDVAACDIVVIVSSSEVINLSEPELTKLICQQLNQTALYKKAPKTDIIANK